MLPFEPPRFGDGGTIGGAVATGLSGPRRPYTGSTRDFVLGVRIINGSRSFRLEVSKVQQDAALQAAGIRTPHTIAVTGTEKLIEASKQMKTPFITKHNQGGKGLGIQLFESVDALQAWISDPQFDAGPGGKVILQQYIQSPEPFITRVEIVGDRFLYAMRSNTSDGFELCPSDACQLNPSGGPEVCPADGPASKFAPSPVTADDPLVEKYIAMCAGEGLDLAGIEFVEDESGQRFTYDINGTTNYSGVFGQQIGVDGMYEFARHLRAEVEAKATTTSAVA